MPVLPQDALTALRHALHQIPEVSGQEARTAAHITTFLQRYQPDRLITHLGGHGVAAIYDSGLSGPTVLIRCELDGLPIPEASDLPYRSTIPGNGHLCGHDGHMVMVAGLAPWLSAGVLARGRVILMFQPAEETGKGAAAVVADPRLQAFEVDYAFALHNMPGLAVGEVALCDGPANCASRGMRIVLTGRTSHAAEPQDGLSPAGVLASLLPQLDALGPGGALNEGFTLTTVTHCQLGEPTFGIAPGVAEVWVTLRAATDPGMQDLIRAAEDLVTTAANGAGLGCVISYDDVFDACENHPEARDVLKSALATAGYPAQMQAQPQKWSEDFGQFRKAAGGTEAGTNSGTRCAMFWLGSGLEQPQLHNPDYDFPDTALPIGLAVFRQVITDLLT